MSIASFTKKISTKKETTAIKENINIHDSILHGISYDDLITTIQANIEDCSTEDVEREFENILQANIKDAKHLLETNMDWIIGQIEGDK